MEIAGSQTSGLPPLPRAAISCHIRLSDRLLAHFARAGEAQCQDSLRKKLDYLETNMWVASEFCSYHAQALLGYLRCWHQCSEKLGSGEPPLFLGYAHLSS
jgi:hypothetical protein